MKQVKIFQPYDRSGYLVEWEKILKDIKIDNITKYKLFLIPDNSQRSHGNKVEAVCDHLNDWFSFSIGKDGGDEFLLKYFLLQRIVLDSADLSEDKLIKSVREHIYFEELIKSTGDYVDANFNPNEYEGFIKSVNDKSIETKSSFPQEYIFYEEHIKALYQASIMIQIFMPLIFSYTRKYGYTNEGVKVLLSKMSLEVFNIIAHETEIDLYSKLYTFVNKQIKATEKSDSLGWERQANFGETKETTRDEIMSKLLTSIIPQFSFDKNIINYISTIIKQTIKNTLKKEDPYEIARLSYTIEGDSDDESDGHFDVETTENIHNRKDERKIIPKLFLIDPTIIKLSDMYNVKVSDEEFAFYFNSITTNINTLQANLLCQVFVSEFSGSDNILACNKHQFVSLIIILYNLLLRHDLDLLASFIIGRMTSHNMNRYPIKNINKKLLANPRYENLINTKYRAVKSLFKEKFVDKKIEENPFIANTMIILNNEFVYNEYNGTRNGEIIDKRNKEDLIIDQLISVCEYMIK